MLPGCRMGRLRRGPLQTPTSRTTDPRMQSAPSDPKAAALAKAQAASSLQNIFLTLFSNVAIATSLALLLYFREGNTLIFWWLGGGLAFAPRRAGAVSPPQP